MIRSKVFQVLTILCALVTGTIKAQSELAIFINEYSASNVTGPTDDRGQHHDWVEIQSAFSSSVSMSNYYLSNDYNDLTKWKFPAGYVLNPGEVKTIWLSGRNTVVGKDVHANFTLDQCEGQWLVLTENGAYRDSIFVRPTKIDHTRGRISNKARGNQLNEWRLYTQHSYLQKNNTTDNYIDYAPKPEIYVSTETDFSPPNKGGFYPGSQIVYVRLGGQTYHPSSQPCFKVYYTLSLSGMHSDYPVPDSPDPEDNTKEYLDSVGFTIDQTTVVRAITVPNPSCNIRYLPSFCETNSYFIDAEHQTFDEQFGVLSLAFDRQDTGWFNNFGPKGHTIHVEYYDDKKQLSEGYGILSKPPQEKWITKQRGFEITMDDRLGFGCGFEGNIFNVEGLGVTSRTMFPTLHVYAGDLESHSARSGSQLNTSAGTGIRDVLIQSIAAKNNLRVSPLHIKPIVTVKEGKYYGLFNFREVFDKYYERYYHGQGPDSLTMNYVQNTIENNVEYWDGSFSAFDKTGWRREVVDLVMGNPMNLKSNYDKLLSALDTKSMIDYMITNSFAVNMNLFRYDVAFAKGGDISKSGGKWHYYLWNMPSILSYTEAVLPGNDDHYIGRSPCHYYLKQYEAIQPSPGLGFMGHGPVFQKLMTTTDNSQQSVYKFQIEFRNRYMDLMNGPFGCEKVLEQFDYINELYKKEMLRHEEPGIGSFGTLPDSWQANMDSLRLLLEQRCSINEDFFNTRHCFGAAGPYPLTVDVRPPGAGRVQLNTTVLDKYLWSGRYYTTHLSFKAIPTSTDYAFHHWEFQNHTPLEPASVDSVNIAFSAPSGENVIAVFTDKTKELSNDPEGANVPSGFTPNGDGINDVFRPLGSAEYSTNYEMVVFNRWGQEVFRSVDPAMGWDGYFKGQQAITGVYAYIISYRNVYGEDKMLKGNVTLTR